MKILYNARIYTLDLGKLAPHYLADLIVLTQDPNVVPPSDLLELEATATMIAGEWVWQS